MVTQMTFTWTVSKRGQVKPVAAAARTSSKSASKRFDLAPCKGECESLLEAKHCATQAYLRHDPEEKAKATLTIKQGEKTWTCIAGDQLGFSSWKMATAEA
jgi:hypothetical protein